MKQIIASLQSTNVSFSVFIPFSSGPSVQAAKCSCCTKGWSSFPARAVRISFSCFSTKSDLRSRRGQAGGSLVLTDARRQDTARNTLLPHTHTRSPPFFSHYTQVQKQTPDKREPTARTHACLHALQSFPAHIDS